MEKDKKSFVKKGILILLSLLLLGGVGASCYFIGNVVGYTNAQKAINDKNSSEVSEALPYDLQE